VTDRDDTYSRTPRIAARFRSTQILKMKSIFCIQLYYSSLYLRTCVKILLLGVGKLNGNTKKSLIVSYH